MGRVEQAVGGVGMEEKKFIWRIENFAVIKKHDELIQAQKFEFQAGGSIGLSSKWTVYLVCNKKKPNYIGIYLHLSEKPKTKQEDYLIAECEFKVKDFMGCCVEKEKIRTKDWYAQNLGSGLPAFIIKCGMFATPLVKGGLVVYCKFRMYANSPWLEKLPVSCSGSGTQVGSSEVNKSTASKEKGLMEFIERQREGIVSFCGVRVEEKKLIWRIENFAVVKSHDKLIEAQKFEFQAGDSIGLSSKWDIHFRLSEEKFPGSIGIFLQLIEKPKTKQEYLIAGCELEIKNINVIESPFAVRKIETRDWYVRPPTITSPTWSWGCGSLVKKTGEVPLVEDSLVIHCNFRMYANSPSLEKMPEDDTLDDKSQLSPEATVGKDLAHVNLYPNLNLLPVSCSCSGIEIGSKEGKQFKASKEKGLVEFVGKEGIVSKEKKKSCCIV